MPRIEEIRDFSRFMDLDSELHNVAPGNTRRRVNMLSDPRNENKGAQGKVPGLRAIPNSYLPSGDNRVLGAIKNTKENTFFLMLYNSLLNHCIFQVTIDSEVVVPVVLNEPKLNFKLTHRISQGGVLGDMLFWSDGYDNGFGDLEFNPPRQVNYKRAIAYTQKAYVGVGVTSYSYGLAWTKDQFCIFQGYIYYAVSVIPSSSNFPPSGDTNSNSHWIYVERFNILETYLNFTLATSERIKYPPVFLDTEYRSDSTKKYNNLRKNYFQFAARYQYADKEYSVASVFSVVPLPEGEEDFQGKTVELSSLNNNIRVLFARGTEEVVAVEIFARDNETKIWKMVNRLDKYNTDGYLTGYYHYSGPPSVPLESPYEGIYDFYNDTLGFTVDQDDIARLFDGVPQISLAMEVIENNKIVDGNFTEGQDNVDIDVTLVTNDKVVEVYNDDLVSLFHIEEKYEVLEYLRHYWEVTLPAFSSSLLGKEFRLSIFLPDQGGILDNKYGDVLNSEANYPDFVFNYLKDAIEANYANWSVRPVDDEPLKFLVVPVDAHWDLYDLTGGVYNSILYNNSTFKHGSWQPFGIVYYDRALRSGTNNISDESKIYIPNYTNEVGPSGNNFISQVRWEIKHRAPIWAKYYEWVWEKRASYLNSEQYYVADADFIEDNEFIYIKINQFLNDQVALNKNINVSPYSYTEGDRIKIIGESNDAQDWVILYDTVFDYPILGEEITVDAPDDYKIFIQNFGKEQLSTFEYISIEIYTPRKALGEDQAVYYGFGELFEIGSPYTSNRYHKKGNDEAGDPWAQDQNPVNYSTTPARGTFLRGDAWVRYRWQDPKSVIVESINYSDYHDSFLNIPGRPSIFDRNSKRRVHENELIHSGQWFSGTEINELNKVLIDGTNKTAVKERYGAITQLEESGYILRVRQKNKVTSIYLGRQGLTTAKEAGIDVVVTSGNLLGTHYYHAQDIGTSNAESCFKDNFGNYYFVDVISKNFVRDNNGGIAPIRQGLAGEIDDIIEGVILSGDTPVFFGAFDSINNRVYIFFGSEDSTTVSHHSTLVYQLGNQETSGFLSFINLYKEISGDLVGPDYMFSMNSKIYVSQLGSLYVLDDFVNPNLFFDVQHESSVEVVFNKAAMLDKNFMSIDIEADEVWSAPNYGDVAIPKNILYPSGMSSKLLEGNFKPKENDYTAEFLKDSSTNSPIPPLAVVHSLNDLINGRDLVGKVLTVTLRNATANQSVIRGVKLISFISKK